MMEIEYLDKNTGSDVGDLIAFIDSLVLQKGRTVMVVLSEHVFTLLDDDPHRSQDEIIESVNSRMMDGQDEDPEFSLDIFDEDRTGYFVTLTNAGIYTWNDDVTDEEYETGNLELGKVYTLRKEILDACERQKILAIIRM